MPDMSSKMLSLGIKMEDLTKAVSDQVLASLRNIGAAAKQAGTQGKQAGKDIESGFTTPKKAVSGLLGVVQGLASSFTALAGIRMGAKLAQDFAVFEDAMLRVGAVSQATQSEYEEMTRLALRMGETTRYTAQQAADGMTFLAMAGLSVSETMQALPAVLNAAAAAQADLGQTADIATNVLTGFGLQVSDLTMVMDKLIGISQSTNSTFQEMGMSFSYAGPIAKAAGQSFNDTAAILGKLHNAGIKGTRAGTTLRGAMSHLLKPTKAARDALEQLSETLGRGIELTNTEGKLRSMIDIMADLEEAGATTSDVISIFGQISGTGIAALLGQGVASIREYSNEIEFMEGRAAATAERMESGLGGALRRLNSAFEGFRLAIAKSLLPVLLAIANGLTLALSAFNSLPGPIKTVVVVIGVAATAYVALRLSIAATQRTLVALNIVTAEQTVLQALNTKATVSATAAQAAMGKALGATRAGVTSLAGALGITATTLGIIVAAIAAVVAILGVYIYNVTSAADKAIKLSESTKVQREEFEGLVKSLEKAKVGTSEYDDIVNRLLQKYPSLTKYVNLYTGELENADEAIKSLNQEMRKQELDALAKSFATISKDIDRFSGRMPSWEAVWASFKATLEAFKNLLIEGVLFGLKQVGRLIEGDFANAFKAPFRILKNFYGDLKNATKELFDENRRQAELSTIDLRKQLVAFAKTMGVTLEEALDPEYLRSFYEAHREEFGRLGVSYDEFIAKVNSLKAAEEERADVAIDANNTIKQQEADLNRQREQASYARIQNINTELDAAKKAYDEQLKTIEAMEAQGALKKEEANKKKLQIEEDYYKKIVDLGKQLVVELEQGYVKDEETFKAIQKRKEEAIKELTTAMKAAWDDYLDSLKKVQELEKDSADRIKGLKEEQHEIDRKLFTEEEKWNDERKKALENEAEIKKLIAAGDEESLKKAAQLIDETKRIYANLAREVKDAQGKVVIGQEEANTAAKEGLNNLVALEEERAAKAIAQEKSIAEERKAHYDELKTQIKDLEAAFDDLESKDVYLNVEANTDDALQKITELKEKAASESIESDYLLDTSQPDAEGGRVRNELGATINTDWIIHKKVVGDTTVPTSGESDSGTNMAAGGLIPGYSPTPTSDNILINATAMEFMQPVRAVKYYGQRFMEMVRTLKFPKALATSLSSLRNIRVPSFAGGGLIPAANTSIGLGQELLSKGNFGSPTDLGRLDLYINGQQVTVTGKRSQLGLLREEAIRAKKRGGKI